MLSWQKNAQVVKSPWQRKMRTLSLILGLLILLVAFLAIIGWQIYKQNSHNLIVEKVSSLVPFPAMQVNSHYLTYYDFLKNYQAAAKFFSQQASQVQYTDNDLRQFAMDRLLFNYLLRQVAAEYKITVTREEMDADLEAIIKNKGSKNEVVAFLRDNYDLTLLEYEKYFILPKLYYNKASEVVNDDETLNGEAKKKIQQALSRLRNNEKFEDLVAEYNGSFSQKQFYRGDLPQAIEDDLYIYEPGEYSDVIGLADSYQILRLDSKDLDKGILTISAIVVPTKNIDQLVSEKKAISQIKYFVQ